MHAPLPAIEVLESRIAPAAILAIDDGNKLYNFDSATPATLSAGLSVTGITSGQILKAIDFRPSTGGLYGIAVSTGAAPFSAQLYTIDRTSGAATAIGVPFSTTLTTDTGIGMDFNPVSDLIRFTDDAGDNFRISPASGVAAADTALTGASTVAALGYTTSYAQAGTTTIYAVDFSTNSLFRVGGLNGSSSPNLGVLTKVATITDGSGAVAVATDVNRAGLDILPTVNGDVAFYSYAAAGLNLQRLARLDLVSGVATTVATIGDGSKVIHDIAVAPLAALTFTAGPSFTYTDGDGDLVTVKTTAGSFDAAKVTTLGSEDGKRFEIRTLDLSGVTTFNKANITFTAKKTAAGGDGRVRIDYLNATGVNLGTVKIVGSLGEIDAGSNIAGTPAIASLTVSTFGEPNVAGAGNQLISTLNGDVGAINIQGDLLGARISVSGALKSATIKGSVIGDDAISSGQISVSGKTTKLTVGGSVVGGRGNVSGSLLLTGGVDSLAIKGSVQGSGGDSSGTVVLSGKSKVVTIGGGIVGGSGDGAGSLAVATASSVTIAGSVAGTATGGGVSIGKTGTFTLGGSLTATGSSAFLKGTISIGTAKTVTIRGGIYGTNGAVATLSFPGVLSPANVAESVSVSTLNILGSVIHGDILFGGTHAKAMSNPNAAAGRVTIGGDFFASDIVAGYAPGQQGFFGIGDVKAGPDTLTNIHADIAAIVIRGAIGGSSGDGDAYGIVADHIGSLTFAGRKIADAKSLENRLLGPYGDLRLKEFGT